MPKAPRGTSEKLKIEAFAKRRAGATYIDASIAARGRLERLRDEYNMVPEGYRGYLFVGICSGLESHIKYCYAYAAERFSDHPDLLKLLYKDINVDIDTIISTSSRTFHLADVIAANIKVSSLDAYRSRASHFFSVFLGRQHDFPWDFARVFETGGDPEGDKEVAARLERLTRVFEVRHNFVHETDILEDAEAPIDDPLECVRDALWLISQFQKQYDHIEMTPKYAVIKDGEGFDDAIGRNLKEIDDAFERIKLVCDERQYHRLEVFKKAFVDFLWAQCDFQASVFISQQSESSMSYFFDLAPQYRETLKEIALKQKYMRSQYPVSRQYSEMGLGPNGDLSPEFERPDEAT